MKPREYMNLIEACHKSKISLIALGQPGIGKTQIVYQVAQKLGIKVFYLPFSVLADRTDFRIGIPDGTRMKFLYSEELPTEQDGEGILLLDDITDADKYLISASKSLLFERKLSKYVVPEKISVIATGNPLEWGGITHIDEKTKTRVLVVKVEIDVEDWLEWARQKGISELIRAFIQFKPDALYYNQDVIISPRNWELIDRLMRTEKDIKILKEILGSMYPAFESFSKSFFVARNNVETIKKILEGEKYQLPEQSQEVFNLLNAIVWYVSDKKLNKEQSINLLRLCKDNRILYEYRIFYLKELLLKKEKLIELKETQEAITYLQGGEYG